MRRVIEEYEPIVEELLRNGDLDPLKEALIEFSKNENVIQISREHRRQVKEKEIPKMGTPERVVYNRNLHHDILVELKEILEVHFPEMNRNTFRRLLTALTGIHNFELMQDGSIFMTEGAF